MNPIRSLSLALLALAPALPAQFAADNLVVVRIGDGVATLSNASTAVFLDEYTMAGSLVRTVALPTVASGANLPCTNSGVATSEGHLGLSGDGRYLVCVGYGTAPGMTGIAGSANPPVARVVARIDMSGNVDTSTAFGDAFNANNIRSATTQDGSGFWAAGANSSIRYVLLGSTTSVMVNTVPANCRVVQATSGQLYVSSSSSPFFSVAAVGTGLPTGTGNTCTTLPGLPAASGPSAYDYWFADPRTLYIADDRTTVGGIQKWTESAGVWSLQYTLSPGTGVVCRAIHGRVDAGMVTVFGTTNEISANRLVSVMDMGATSTFTTIATANASTVLRGVRQIPHTGRYVVFGPGCSGTLGVPGNVAGTWPNLGQTLTAHITNLPTDAAFFLFGWSNTVSGFGPLPLDLTGFGAPGCFGRVSADSVVLILGAPNSHLATFSLPIPNNVVYLGTTFYTQGLSLNAAANALGLVPSDAARVVVGS